MSRSIFYEFFSDFSSGGFWVLMYGCSCLIWIGFRWVVWREVDSESFWLALEFRFITIHVDVDGSGINRGRR